METSPPPLKHYEEEVLAQQNQENSKIYLELSLLNTPEERKNKIIELIEENIFNFLSFME